MKIKEELYSSYKAAHHLDKIDKLRKGELVFPTQIQVDLTNRCNHDCAYCFYRGVNSDIVTQFDRRAELPFKTVRQLINDMVVNKIPAIQITGGGEPLMYPQFLDVIKIINDTEIELALVTNGALMTDEIIDNMTKASWIRVSVDAAKADTYGDLQRCAPKEFDKVISNISKLVNNLKNTVVGVSFVVSPENYKEIYEAALLYKELGVHNVRFSIAYTENQTKIFEPFMAEMIDLTDKARNLTDDNYRVFALNTDHMEHLGYKKKYKICGYSHLTAAIEATGKVRPCCTLKALPHSCFGNINDNLFSEIWMGETRKSWLKKFDSNLCELCWMDSKNEFIEYLITQDPMHVNYV